MATLDYHKHNFYLDIIDEAIGQPTPFVGYTSGHLWNGWAVPLFLKDEADRLVEALNTVYGSQPRWVAQLGLAEKQPVAWYDAEQDAYVTVSEDEAGQVDWWESVQVFVDGALVTVYPIGAQCWTWSHDLVEDSSR